VEHLPPVGTANAVEGVALEFLRGQPGQAWDAGCTICGTALFTDDQYGVSIRAERTPLKKL